MYVILAMYRDVEEQLQTNLVPVSYGYADHIIDGSLTLQPSTKSEQNEHIRTNEKPRLMQQSTRIFRNEDQRTHSFSCI